MSANNPGELDLLIEKATSESIPNGELDLPVALEISDVIKSRKVSARDGMRCLKKRIANTSQNPNTQLSSWKLVDVCTKNCGMPFLVEICSREFMDSFEHTILKTQDNNSYAGTDEIYEVTTKLFYQLYVAFKNDSQLSYIARVYDKLKSRGVHFPVDQVNTNEPMAIFDSKTPADWIDSDACMICSKNFSILNRRHHCRSCGGIFCQDHSSHNIPLPDLGIYEEVRVCDNCFDDYDMKKHAGERKSHLGGRNKKKKKRGYIDDEEDEQLRKAIELSLRESSSTIEPIVPVVEEPATSSITNEEDDPELRAAIQASLREAEDAKKRQELYQHPQQQEQPQLPQLLQAAPSLDITTSEEQDIYLFASLVEKMQNEPVNHILENPQLQTLYQKVLASKPKLNTALNDRIQKYNTLIEMNSKISDIMNIYDQLLEQQLRNINMSQQYSIPEQPSDPYANYYQPQISSVPSQANFSPAAQHSEKQSELTNNEVFTETQTLVPEQTSKVTPEVLELQPSEPPYPEEDEHHESEVTNLNGNATNIPYPVEEQAMNQNSKDPAITRYNFPTVPAKKLQPQAQEQQEIPQDETKIDTPQEEELLLEL